jgi:hypothetical protein
MPNKEEIQSKYDAMQKEYEKRITLATKKAKKLEYFRKACFTPKQPDMDTNIKPILHRTQRHKRIGDMVGQVK